MHVLVAGCGWLGVELARRLVARGDRVTGIRRDHRRAAALAELGVTPLALDLAAPGAEDRIPQVDAIVACQAAGGESLDEYRAAYIAANRALLTAAAHQRVRAFVYTGSTGVFGQRDGSDVDEHDAPAPATEPGRVLAAAERLILEAIPAVPARIVRLSGLYGPARAGIIERVRSGRLALGDGDEAWMNFCHRDDAVAFVLAALDRGEPGATYHGTDATPARRREVVGWIAEQLGIEPPRSAAPASAEALNRRIWSAWTCDELGIALAYPSFREGLAPLLGAGDSG